MAKTKKEKKEKKAGKRMKKKELVKSTIGLLPRKTRRSTVPEIHFRTTASHYTPAENAVYGYTVRTVG